MTEEKSGQKYDPERWDYGKYIKKYRDRNPEKHKYYSYKSTTKTFIRHHATEEELNELKKLINERREEIQSDN
ncbi:hypothetical protein [Heyndrickxia ginsengihumi]|uniref:hypothetical protein n=1 Tax=Heyndrickxia ginsengihumi TaxID=363870 RepID=UPI0004729F54|nr:hypothetical protein [Heyndrickxia ginsengihumi]